jgi:D-sedoheptulose 7-phosphate isomerase
MNIKESIARYFKLLAKLPKNTLVTDKQGTPLSLDMAFRDCILDFRANAQMKNKIMFIGNGASAAISSHMASDYTKAGGFRAVCFNDGASLTCLANDFSYEEAFAKQVEYHAIPGDILIAISSSGNSKNIINAVLTGRRKGCKVITLSGFQAG